MWCLIHAIQVGDKLHIITRRRFENDIRRHFVGEVTAISDGLQEIRGFAFVFSAGVNEYRRRPEPRTRLFSVAQDGFIVTKIPPDSVIATLNYMLLENTPCCHRWWVVQAGHQRIRKWALA